MRMRWLPGSLSPPQESLGTYEASYYHCGNGTRSRTGGREPPSRARCLFYTHTHTHIVWQAVLACQTNTHIHTNLLDLLLWTLSLFNTLVNRRRACQWGARPYVGLSSPSARAHSKARQNRMQSDIKAPARLISLSLSRLSRPVQQQKVVILKQKLPPSHLRLC